MDRLIADVRFALHAMLRAPLVFVLAIVSLAVGVAANTTIFSALDAFLIRPLPYDQADRIVRVWATNPERGWDRVNASQADLIDWRAQSRTVDLAGYSGGSMNVSGGETPERLRGIRTTSNLLDVLAVKPQVGRMFTAGEDVKGGERVVLISHSLWQRRYAGRMDAVGSTLSLNGEAHTVIGILPDGLHFPDRETDIFTPLRADATDDRGNRWVSVIGRLRAGATEEAAADELTSIAASLSGMYPATNGGIGARVLRLDRAMFDTTFRTAATICMVAVIFVLLIACSNVANLLLARAATREREIAVRSVLGAGRWRVVRQLLTESIVLALLAGALGWLLSIWGVRGLISIMPADFPMVDRIALSDRALLFTLVVSIGSGLVFGLAPALHAARPDLGTVLRDGGSRGAIGGGRAGRLRATFVVAEIGLALVLLICAGLLIKGYRRSTESEFGFNTKQLITMRVSLPENVYQDTANIVAFHDGLAARLRTIPGVTGIVFASTLPLQGGSSTSYATEDARALPEAQKPVTDFRIASADYFQTLGVPLKRGRTFSAQDQRAGAPVAIINEALAERHWKTANPVGRQLEVNGTLREIVGVVGNVHEWGGANSAPPVLYLPLTQRPARTVSIGVRSALPVASVVPAMRDAVKQLDANLPLYDVQTMDQIILDWDSGNRVLAQLLAIFAGIALMLAMLGVYGVMAYNVSQRTQEVGIRMAIGAQRADIVRLILRHGTVLAGAGVVLGVALAAGVARFLSAFLNGVSPFDPLTFTGFPLALFVVGLVASYVPARRATRVDPLTALRNE